MPRYTDIDKLIAEYDRVHVGPAGGARKLMVEAPIADVVPRAEVAIKIFSDIENIAKTVGFPEALVNGMIVNNILDGLYIDSQDFAELKKKYTEGQK